MRARWRCIFWGREEATKAIRTYVFVRRGKNLFNRHRRHGLAERFEIGERANNLVPANFGLRDNARDALAAPRNAERFAALDLVEQARQTGFCFPSLNFPHERLKID